MQLARRTMLGSLGAAAALLPIGGGTSVARAAAGAGLPAAMRRVRPGDPDWPSAAAWEELNRAVGGRLIKVKPLLAACEATPASASCNDLLHNLKDPYFIGEQPAVTESSGWVDAWRSAPSAYAVPAHSTADVVAAVNFARAHRLRLVMKGGGHSYLGGSNAPDSLLVWMRPMDAITQHDSFVPQGCRGQQPAVPAVSVGTGARWLPVYNAVTTKASGIAARIFSYNPRIYKGEHIIYNGCTCDGCMIGSMIEVFIALFTICRKATREIFLLIGQHIDCEDLARAKKWKCIAVIIDTNHDNWWI